MKVHDRLHSPWDIKAWKALLQNKFDLNFISRDFEDWRYRQLSLIVSTVKSPQQYTADDSEVVIIEHPRTSARSKALCVKLVSELEQRSVTVRKVLWGVDSFVFEGKKYLSLLELENPVLARPNASDFAAIKRLVLQSSSLLAVSSDDPAGNLFVGMARSIRNEIPDKHLRTLTVQSKSLDSPEILASAIARLATTLVEDNEFKEEDGLLKVPRVIEDTSMNKQIESSLLKDMDFIEMISLNQADGPQKLTIRNQGILDTLCYEKDDSIVPKIADDEVEIQVKASGLKYIYPLAPI